MANLYGPPAPVKKKKAPNGPIQPAFPIQEYMGNPWTKVMNGEMPLNVPPMVQVPITQPPVNMQDTRISESPLEVPNIETENNMKPQLKPEYLPRVSIGGKMGESAESKLTSDQANTTGLRQDVYMDPSEFNALVAGVEQTEPIKRQLAAQAARDQLGIDVMSSLPGGVDVTPLMALVDQWTGSKLAQSYRPPANYEQRAKTLLDFADKAQKGRQELADSIFKNVQYMKAGSYQDQQIQKLGEMLGYGNKNAPPPGSGNRGRQSAIDDWKVIQEGNKVYKEFQESKSRLDALDAAFASRDVGSIGRALSIAARELSGEKGVLTEQDVGRVLPKTIGMSAAQFEAYILDNPQVLVDPNVIEGLKQEAKRARARLKTRQREKLGALQNSMKNSPAFAGKTSLLDPYAASIGEPTPEAPAGPSLGELFKKRLEQRMNQEKGKDDAAKK